jgi:hypothetical protein
MKTGTGSTSIRLLVARTGHSACAENKLNQPVRNHVDVSSMRNGCCRENTIDQDQFFQFAFMISNIRFFAGHFKEDKIAMEGKVIREPGFVHAGSHVKVGAIAGLAGGAAEIGWISIYQNVVGHESSALAAGVTQSVIPGLAPTPLGVPLGVSIHMVLAILLGVAIAMLVKAFMPRIVGTLMEPVVVIIMLAGVWAANFFILLPMINPEFVLLVPYGASFVSKMLFGFMAAFVFWCAHRFRSARH